MDGTKSDGDRADRSFDAIVIGSGIGGLTAAGLLARVWHKRVLVLEKHFEPGGLTHAFVRGRYRWDVGVHYVGRMAPGCLQRDLLDYITERGLEWRALPSPVERFVYPEFIVPQSSDAAEFRRTLVEMFPLERRAIRRYFRDVRRTAIWLKMYYLEGFLSAPLRWVFPLLKPLMSRWALRTTREYLHRRFRDRRLRAVVASQWGDYGMPPEESAFAIHATLVDHFIKGAWFPEHSSSRIAHSMEYAVEREGGMLLVNRDAVEVLLDGGRACGVRVVDRRFGDGREEEYYAPVVISNVGVRDTFTKLVPGRQQRCARPLTHLEPGYSSVIAYLGLSGDPASLGVGCENLWINTTYDHEDMEAQTRDVLEGTPRRCYVSFPSVKGGAKAYHTAEVIAIVKYAPFERWREQRWRERDTEYYELKKRVGEGLVNLACAHLPGLRDMIVYQEVSTPLTLEHFGGRERGPMYGCAPTAERFSRHWSRVRTHVPGLFISGSDACTLGVTGAMMGGVAAASSVIGPPGFATAVVAAKRWVRRNKGRTAVAPALKVDVYPAISDKVQGQLASKVRLTDSVYEFDYELDRDVEYLPGQYARIRHGESDYGSYSIVSIDELHARFIIDTKFGGSSSKYFVGLAEGEHSTMRLPVGDFSLVPSDNRKAFVSTGTGVAPLLAMMAELERQCYDEEIDVYFGCRFEKDRFVDTYLDQFEKLRIRRTVCISGEQVPGCVHGRVTVPLAKLNGKARNTDFYVSGNPSMVIGVNRLLRSMGAERVYTESY